MNKDIYQKIASLADDKTALRILASHKDLYNDKYFQIIFGERYPDLIKFKSQKTSDELYKVSLKDFYLKKLEEIGKLREKYNYTYKTGDPSSHLYLLKISKKLSSFGLGFYNRLLTNASNSANLEMIQFALDNGADIHHTDDLALQLAFVYGKIKSFKYLIQNGADLNEIYTHPSYSRILEKYPDFKEYFDSLNK